MFSEGSGACPNRRSRSLPAPPCCSTIAPDPEVARGRIRPCSARSRGRVANSAIDSVGARSGSTHAPGSTRFVGWVRRTTWSSGRTSRSRGTWRCCVVPDEIDLVITASCSIANEASRQLALRLAPRAAHLTLNAACSGFCYAVSAADSLIRTGSARHVLVVAAEHMSALVDPTDLGTAIIFGDGVGPESSVRRTDDSELGQMVGAVTATRRD